MIEEWPNQVVKTSLADAPTRHLSALPLLEEDNRQPLLVERNRTRPEYPSESCLHELFEAQVKSAPEKIALVCDQQQVTYGELNRRACHLAHYLRHCGVGPEQMIGIMSHRSVEMVVGLLGILKAGGAFVPLDAGYPPERLSFMLKDARISLLLTQRDLMAGLRLGVERLLYLDADEELLAQQSEENPDGGAQPDNPAYVIYTSGSTGRPKGVLIPHRSVVSYISTASVKFEIEPSDRVLQFASLSFDVSVEEIFTCLTRGATLALRTDAMLSSIASFLAKCEEWAVTVLDLPTAYWHEFTASLDSQSITLPTCIRQVIIGGERAQPHSLADWRKHIGPRVRLINAYGPTEATIAATMCELSEPVVAEAVRRQEVPIGKAFPHAKVYLLDSDLQPAPNGVVDEVYVGGHALARCYLNRPDLTAEKFIPHPFSAESGARLYRTSDLGRSLPDGNIEFQGRIDSQVKIRGFRIELGEIESVLQSDPTVCDAVVIAREDTPGAKRLVAYVVPHAHRAASINQLRNFLKERLPAYMIPAVFVSLEALPLALTGKVDRKALPMPDQTRPDCSEDFVAPRTPIEERIADLWARALCLDHVGINDNFFELGGDSLRATQLLTHIRETFGVEMSVSNVFNAPTVSGFAAAIESAKQEAQNSQLPPLRPVPRDRPMPVTFPQQAIWLLCQLNYENLAYNTQLSIRFIGQLDIEALNRSLTEIVRRHEIFRTTFSAVNDQPVQIIHPPWIVNLPVMDLTAIAQPEREAEVERLIQEECWKTFDITQLPLLRWKLLRLGAEEHVLIQVEHHLVHDGWSLSLLLREMKTLYEAFTNGRPSPLPELPIQFADFAVWQREWLQGEILESLLAFWKKHLAGSPPLLELLTDRPRPKVQSFRGAALMFELPSELCAKLRHLSQRAGVTLFMTMLAAFKTLLYRYTGQEDLVIGSSVANRRLRETETLIGMIVNTIVLRTDLSGNPTFLELLARVRDMALDAYAHQDLPFEKLVEELQPERGLSYNPLFQLMFNFHDAQVPQWRLPNLTGQLQYRQNRSAKFDLNIVVIPRFEKQERAGLSADKERLLIDWEYSTDLFDEATMTRMREHYQTLLEGIVANPEQRFSELPLLTEAERRQLLIKWDDQQVNGGETPETAQPFASPSNPIEEQLMCLWKGTLGLEQFSVYDNFFALGGGTEKAAQLVAQICETFQIEFPLGSLLQSPTVAGLAAVIASLQAQAAEERESELLQLLEGLSEDEIETELLKRIQADEKGNVL